MIVWHSVIAREAQRVPVCCNACTIVCLCGVLPNPRFLLHGLPAFWAWCVVQGAPLCTEMTTAQPLESSRHYTTA